MAEYNKVMTQIKPDLPKVIDTEQIYVYVPKASYDQAGIMKPDKTQFVIAGDYTLTIKHFEMTDDHVAVDVKMGYKNDTALSDLADKDFVTKGGMTGYSVERIPNTDDYDKAYVESKIGTKLVRIDKSAVADTIAVRDTDGALHAAMHDTPQADELVHYTYLSKNYVKATTNGNKVYATDAAGKLIYAPFSSAASTDTFVIRQPDGSIRGFVSTPEDTTLLNHQYVRSHYIPVGSDGKIPNSYLPANIGADEIVMGYFYQGDFYLDKDHTVMAEYDTEKLYVDIDTNVTYRWSVTEDYSGFVEISSSLALGTSHDTAYYGDFGDAAYAHSRSKGNPHNTGISDIPNLRTTLERKVGAFSSSYDAKRVVAFLADQNSDVMCTIFNQDMGGTFYVKSNVSPEWIEIDMIAIRSGITYSRLDYEPRIKITTSSKPVINGVPMTSTTITVPIGMMLDIEFETTDSTTSTDYYVNISAARDRFVAYFWQCSNSNSNNAYKVPLYNSEGELKTEFPAEDDNSCLNIAYWKANYLPFNYTTISTLSSVARGFNVEYQIDGKSAEIEIPLEGTNDVVVDVDETNQMINIHLDASVRAKLAKMLTLPATAPAKNSIVGVGTNNAQMIMTEQEARDAISVFKTVSLTQTEYNNLAVKDNKTLYLITG